MPLVKIHGRIEVIVKRMNVKNNLPAGREEANVPMATIGGGKKKQTERTKKYLGEYTNGTNGCLRQDARTKVIEKRLGKCPKSNHQKQDAKMDRRERLRIIQANVKMAIARGGMPEKTGEIKNHTVLPVYIYTSIWKAGCLVTEWFEHWLVTHRTRIRISTKAWNFNFENN